MKLALKDPMKRFAVCLILAAFAGVPALHAQAVVEGPRALDAAETELRDQLLVLRDTLQRVYASAARFTRDPMASPALLVSRARGMEEACRSSLRTLPSARQTVEHAKFGPRMPKAPEMRTELLRSMGDLATALGACETEFAAMGKQMDQPQTIRDAAGNRSYRVTEVLKRYDRSLAAFFASTGIDVRPLGSGRSPIAG